jgi:hypothetical protein
MEKSVRLVGEPLGKLAFSASFLPFTVVVLARQNVVEIIHERYEPQRLRI